MYFLQRKETYKHYHNINVRTSWVNVTNSEVQSDIDAMFDEQTKLYPGRQYRVVEQRIEELYRSHDEKGNRIDYSEEELNT